MAYLEHTILHRVSDDTLWEYAFVTRYDEANPREYIGNLEYENGELSRINTPYGYYNAADSLFYGYLTDRQGNIRVVYTPSDSIQGTFDVIQSTSYYPYGMPIAVGTGADKNRYKYSGKEFETRFGFNLYDFHARPYDPATLLFTGIDPKAPDYPSLNPYLYCAANPIAYIDPTGMKWENVEQAEELKNSITDKMENLFEDVLKEVCNISALEKSGKDASNARNNLNEITANLKNLTQSYRDIDRLGADPDNIYKFSQIDESDPHYVYQGANGVIVIFTSNDAISVHEITHISQSLDAGGLIFNDSNQLINAASSAKGDLYKKVSEMEVEAYKRQYSVDSRSMPKRANSVNEVDFHYVGSLRYNNKILYPYVWKYSEHLKGIEKMKK